MDQTANYGLSQWEKADRIQMENFNSDNAKIDAALKASADAVASHTTALAKLGNCKITVQSYKGAGKYGSSNANSLTFEAQPVLAIIISQTGKFMLSYPGITSFPYGTNTSSLITWNDKTMTWYSTTDSSSQYNANGSTYYVVALIAKS